jgi:predicted GNAT family acetyltransferase
MALPDGRRGSQRPARWRVDTVRLERFETVADYLARVGSFLSDREAEHNLVLATCSHLKAAPELFAGRPDLIAAIGGFRVVATAIRTPPLNIVLSEVDDPAALAAFVEAFATNNPAGLTGPAEHAATFSELWSARTGRGHRLSKTERLFGLTWVERPATVRGVLRAAVRSDRELLAAWLRAYESETLGREVAPIAAATIDRWLAGRGRTMYLWDDGGPVSMCGVGGATPHGIRVGPVYTPRELRNHGYAGACVAAASQAQLDGGRSYCFLFTDLANPAANHLFEAIGYEEIRDIAMYAFDRE